MWKRVSAGPAAETIRRRRVHRRRNGQSGAQLVPACLTNPRDGARGLLKDRRQVVSRFDVSPIMRIFYKRWGLFGEVTTEHHQFHDATNDEPPSLTHSVRAGDHRGNDVCSGPVVFSPGAMFNPGWACGRWKTPRLTDLRRACSRRKRRTGAFP